MKKVFLIHPILFAIISVIIIFSANVEFIPFSQLWLPLFLTGLLGTILFISLGLIFKNFYLSALIASPFYLFFLFVGSIYAFVAELIVDWKYRYIVLLVIAIITILALSFFYYQIIIRRKTHRFLNLNKIFFAVACFILVTNLAEIAFRYKSNQREHLPNITFSLLTANENAVRPDIYYIILDEYASLDQIKEDYGYDNTQFAERLKRKGFVIPKNSTTKYASTNNSLCESLNMGKIELVNSDASSFLSKITEFTGFVEKKDKIVMERIRNNEVVNVLKNLGYKYIHFGSWWRETKYNTHADKNINYYGCRVNNELSALLLESSFFRLFFINKELYRNGIRYAFDNLNKIPSYESPKFVFFHLFLPHAPFVFKDNGESVSWRESSSLDHNSLYLGQYIFTTKMIEKTVHLILATSKEPPIIILQSDHGSRFYPKNKHKIFCALYLPYGGSTIVDDNIMPGEIFQKIFKFYFGIDEKDL